MITKDKIASLICEAFRDMEERKYCIAVKYGPNGADKRYYYKRGRVLFTAKEALDFVEETIATQEGFTEDDFEIIDESI